MFQNLNSQITNELLEPNPFVKWELSAVLKITRGNKHKKEISTPLGIICSPSTALVSFQGGGFSPNPD